jgi:hypothetical protein
LEVLVVKLQLNLAPRRGLAVVEQGLRFWRFHRLTSAFFKPS